MWLHVYDDQLFVDTDAYIESQPVKFEQVEDVIISLTQPVNTYIDVSRVDVLQVDIVGLIKIVWELHLKTKDQPLLKNIYFKGASPYAKSIWNTLRYILPSFVTRCVIFIT
jgi:hypothetical protein